MKSRDPFSKRAKKDSHQMGGFQGIGRRDFVKSVGLGGAVASGGALRRPEPSTASSPVLSTPAATSNSYHDTLWPSFRHYDQQYIHRVAMPIGGIGTGTISLAGRGGLKDWEIMNRPAKGFVPMSGEVGPFFALFTQSKESKACRLLEGPVPLSEYEGSHGSRFPNENLPRFRKCFFDSAYPFGRVTLADSALPVDVEIKAFNPLIPTDVESSSLPVVALTFRLVNKTEEALEASVCATIPNFIGVDGWETRRDWKGDRLPVGASGNYNTFQEDAGLRGILFNTDAVDPLSPAWGNLSLTTSHTGALTYRTSWARNQWGTAWLDFWDDFSDDGQIEQRSDHGGELPLGSLATSVTIQPKAYQEVTFYITWYFPNRYAWNTPMAELGGEDLIGNYYTSRFESSWDVAVSFHSAYSGLYERTAEFVGEFCSSDLQNEVKEAALFNLSTLRTQTCFQTADGHFYGWEGTADSKGCCHGSCTHVWNYEQATAFLFGSLSSSMRKVEFGHATDDLGLMSFRVNLPLSKAQEFGKAAADGQMGCIMKMYRDWQLSGDTETLRKLWPKVRKAVEFCWIKGGWDADQDGVMEGCQHNTMDVEYYGPNPQMGIWYLGALRAAEEMALALEDTEFADLCNELFLKGSSWMDENLFNGEYYEHRVRPPREVSEIAPSLLIGMGAADPTNPDYQLAEGCLVDQMVGQFMAHVCGLGYLVEKDHVRKTLHSIYKYNRRQTLDDHFNCMRSFALDGEPALLMASYPRERPSDPFPYFTEAMTGFEYTAAVGMLYEGLLEEGLSCISAIRSRYDGRKRNPFDEAECGHHYARAMASWAAVLALSGFQYSAVEGRMVFAAREAKSFWSTGYAWGTCKVSAMTDRAEVELRVFSGRVKLSRIELRGFGFRIIDPSKQASAGDILKLKISQE